ncbi:prolyl oligopeptidase family serine peptidase [Paraburkholderia megapolitana]|uniref:Prolyl oligopeptidase n=1 Tax=Paraburkholderia megapolitana TaxID=420953 RepID=A0A1I3MTM5_9BURK|nr:prolyl oligopeptidase family serine peptidase [Paraburkholderia megapolitana]QDQ84131.1 S9 family peptidase [Paraburkholderia megapolitana]SFJ00291.1 prolyl oligopeptidase [Paraburkholderia megapolitana]
MTNSLPTTTWPSTDAADPYIGLEKLDDPTVDSWVRAQTARTMETFGHTPNADIRTRRLFEAMTAQDRIVTCLRYGDWGYNYWTDEAHPLFFVRRTPWDAWIEGVPEWETVLDVNALDLNNRDGDETRWVLAGFDLIYPTFDRALVSLAPGGSDSIIVREFDVEARAFVDNGFALPDPGYHRVGWIDRNTIYVSWDDSAVSAVPAVTVAGYPRQVRKWTRGMRVSDAPIVFECEPDDLSAEAFFDPIHRRHSAYRSASFYDVVYFWLDEKTDEWREFDVPRDATLFGWNDWLLVTLRTDWDVDAATYRSGSLLAIRRDAFLDGSRCFVVLFAPADEKVLSGAHYTKHWLIVAHKSESVTRVTLWRPLAAADGTWEARDYPLPDGCEASVTAIDHTRDDTVLIYTNHFLTPPSLHLADLASDTPWRLLAQLPARFDASGFVALRRHAVAADGVRIPYWVIGRETDLQGDPRPCVLYGYGGFEIPLDTPGYIDTLGFSWLEPGGVYVIACIRGGGEYGPAWHRAAQREKRQVAFDDFIAVAEALIDSGVTTPTQLAIQGGSNGGLLTAVCMIQRPELFGAVVSEVPVLDMARFHLLLQGASWVEEYGDPDNADDRRMLMDYSPYHNVKPDTHYPPVLFTSSSTDDRVHPAHARKMVAKMQALGHADVWYLEHRDGGHGAGVEPETMARAVATTFEFLRAKIGAALQPVRP